MTTYDQFDGGMPVSAAVDRFFRRVLNDATLAPAFDGAALHRLAAQQHAFLTSALGSAYQPTAGVAAVTAGPGTDAALTAHLAAALAEVGVPAAAIAQVTAAAVHPTDAIAYVPSPVAAFTVPPLPAPTKTSPVGAYAA